MLCLCYGAGQPASGLPVCDQGPQGPLKLQDRSMPMVLTVEQVTTVERKTFRNPRPGHLSSLAPNHQPDTGLAGADGLCNEVQGRV